VKSVEQNRKLKSCQPRRIKSGECADAARADYMLTGNLRHFPMFWEKTKVITSREFIGIVYPHLMPW